MILPSDFTFVLCLLGAVFGVWAAVGLWKASAKSPPATLIGSVGLGFAIRVVVDLALNAVSLQAVMIWRDEWLLNSPTLAVDAAFALLAGLAAFRFVIPAPTARPRISAAAVTLAAAVTGSLGIPPLASIPLVAGSQTVPSDAILVMEQAGRQLAWLVPLLAGSIAVRLRMPRSTSAEMTAPDERCRSYSRS